MKKIINSFKELSALNRREIFVRDKKSGEVKLKPRLNPQLTISIARQLATGFDAKKTREKPTKEKLKEAREIITEYYEAASSGKTKVFRPHKKNRKAYAETADMSSRFKVYPMPVLTDGDKFAITTERVGKKRIRKAKMVGDFIDRESFNYPNLKQMSIKPEIETNKLLKRIDKKIGKKTKRALKFKVGKYETKAIYDQENVSSELEKWKQVYGAKKIKSFVVGLQVYTFRNQKDVSHFPSTLKRKKPKTVRRSKIRMK